MKHCDTARRVCDPEGTISGGVASRVWLASSPHVPLHVRACSSTASQSATGQRQSDRHVQVQTNACCCCCVLSHSCDRRAQGSARPQTTAPTEAPPSGAASETPPRPAETNLHALEHRVSGSSRADVALRVAGNVEMCAAQHKAGSAGVRVEHRNGISRRENRNEMVHVKADRCKARRASPGVRQASTGSKSWPLRPHTALTQTFLSPGKARQERTCQAPRRRAPQRLVRRTRRMCPRASSPRAGPPNCGVPASACAARGADACQCVGGRHADTHAAPRRQTGRQGRHGSRRSASHTPPRRTQQGSSTQQRRHLARSSSAAEARLGRRRARPRPPAAGSCLERTRALAVQTTKTRPRRRTKRHDLHMSLRADRTFILAARGPCCAGRAQNALSGGFATLRRAHARGKQAREAGASTNAARHLVRRSRSRARTVAYRQLHQRLLRGAPPSAADACRASRAPEATRCSLQ